MNEERIIFQNDACLVINKLPGESSEFPQAAENAEGEKFPVAVHRLDMPVSGCLLLAKNPLAAAFLGDAFSRPAKSGPAKPDKAKPGQRQGRAAVEKIYWAIIEKPAGERKLASEGELVHWIVENSKQNKSYAYPIGTGQKLDKAKKAVMRYRFTGEGENYLFLEVELVTGRHHQIRAQLAAVGLHVKGDLKYGARRSEKAGGIRLHAYSLKFPNPLKADELIQVKAPPSIMDPLWSAFMETSR